MVDIALDIIDRRTIRFYQNINRTKSVIEVTVKQNQFYRFLPDKNYCSCDTFCCQVIDKCATFTCEHILAAKLAQLIGKIEIEIVSDDVLSLYLSSIN